MPLHPVDNRAGEIAIEDRRNVNNMEDQADEQEFGNIVVTWGWGRIPFGHHIRRLSQG